MEPMDDAELYDLAPAAPPAAPAGPARSVEAPPKATLHYQRASQANPVNREETLRDFQLPIWLLSGGVVVEMAAAFLHHPHAPADALVDLGLNLVVGTALTLTGVMLAAKLRAIDLGSFGFAVLKVAALSVAPAAVMELASPMLGFIPLGGLVGLLVEFVLYFALLGAMFDLDESDTWYCLCVMFLVRLGVAFAAMGTMGRWF
jgi:hypothetical protein